MKKYHKLLVAFILAVSAMLPVASSYAGRIFIQVGDRPYYSRGPYYWERGHRWVWVPGHWSRHHRVWIHGHYRRV